MRFITEFEITPNEIKEGNTHIKDHRKSCAEERLGGLISELFGFKKAIFMDYSGLPVDRHSLEIEAFPVDKWVEFKQRLFSEIATCNDTDFPVDGARILSWIKELESFGKPSGDAITNLSGQMEYRGPSSHCKACEDEKNGVKHIMAQKHTCRK